VEEILPEMFDMSRKRVKVTHESDTGRNQRFHDNYTGEDMTRKQFVDKIKRGEYPNHHVRNINGVDTPVFNPDKSESNNLD
jgi:vacuolar-type H+-ATPase subunit D/Vma8